MSYTLFTLVESGWMQKAFDSKDEAIAKFEQTRTRIKRFRSKGAVQLCDSEGQDLKWFRTHESIQYPSRK